MQVTSSDGALIGYETLGQGPPLILVDGAMCYRGGGPMRPLADRLADAATVLLYDRRGRGASGDVQPYGVQREVDDLAALIEVTGGSAALVGISSGGALAVLAAGRLGPRRVPAVAVYEPPYSPEAERAAALAYARELSGALALPSHELAVRLFLERVGATPERIEAIERSPGWAGLLELAPTLAYDAAVMADGALPAEVADLAMPVLGLVGEVSPETLQYGARALVDAVRNGEFEVLVGQTHDVDPDVLAARLKPFLAHAGGLPSAASEAGAERGE